MKTLLSKVKCWLHFFTWKIEIKQYHYNTTSIYRLYLVCDKCLYKNYENTTNKESNQSKSE